jgi:hypothetical protein
MTGGGRGFCALKMPQRPDEPIRGFAGRTGWPFALPPGPEAALAQLRSQATQIEKLLRAVRGRIERLEAGGANPI